MSFPRNSQCQSFEMEPGPEPSVAEGRGCHFGSMLFPFIKLTMPLREPCTTLDWTPTRTEMMFLLFGILWTATAFNFVYMFLAISSRSNCDTKVDLEDYSPSYGDHMNYIRFAKQAVQLYVLHRICGDLTKYQEEPDHPKTSNLERRGRPGVIAWVSKLGQAVAQRPGFSDKWVSTYVADHILLVLAGVGYIAHQIALVFVKVKSPAASCLGDESIVMVVSQAVVSSYMAVNVIGFVWNMLEHGVLPKDGRGIQFTTMTTVFLMLWSSEFMMVLLDRYVYTAGWSPASPLQRTLASLAQIFVTHSSIMTGAILLGHSAHFARSPDISWTMLFCRILPVLGSVLSLWLWIGRRRAWHIFPECRWFVSSFLVLSWPWFQEILRVLGGGVLFAFALCGLSDREERDDRRTMDDIVNQTPAHLVTSRIVALVDYDIALILMTSSLAILWNIIDVYTASKSSFGLALTAIGLLGFVGPGGLCLFAISSWRRPARLAKRRNRFIGWFALFFAMSWFVIFEDKEDCEISSPEPYCCNYPGLLEPEETHELCNFDQRCKHRYPEPRSLWYCPSPHEVHSAAPQALHASQLLEMSDADVSCSELKERHGVWQRSGLAKEELEEEEKRTPLALLLFRTVGTAASVEMYFTIVGVLLKVLILTGSPISRDVLRMNADHHSRHGTPHDTPTNAETSRQHGLVERASVVSSVCSEAPVA